MKEPKLRYNSHNKHDLRDPYPVFYYSMLKFIDSLPGNWFFDECIPFDYDGIQIRSHFARWEES